MEFWSIVKAELGTNLIKNPVAMGSGNYGAISTATVTPTAGNSYLGYMHYAISNLSSGRGAYFNTKEMEDATYVTVRSKTAIALWEWSVDSGSTYHTPTLLRMEGEWYVYGYFFPYGEAYGSTEFRMVATSAISAWIIGHIQAEVNTGYSTTPITGDMIGFTEEGYVWNGVPHGSSSTRSSKERSGGRIRGLADYFHASVIATGGIGTSPVKHRTNQLATLPGSWYTGQKIQDRILTLVLDLPGTSQSNLHVRRKELISYITENSDTEGQPVTLLFDGANATGNPMKFHCVYDSGLEYNKKAAEGFNETIPLKMIGYDPFFYPLWEGGQSLVTETSINPISYLANRHDGLWTAATLLDEHVYRLHHSSYNNCVYVAGQFTFTPPSTCNYIFYIDPEEGYKAMTSGTNGAVRALASDAAGNVYLGGAFTLAGGVSNTVRVAMWNGTNYVPLLTGISSGTIYAMVVDRQGNLYISGSFTNHGDADGDYLTKWLPGSSSFQSVSTGLDNIAYAMAVDQNNVLYLVGAFATCGGVSCAHVAAWDGTSFYPLGDGLTGGTGIGRATVVDKAGNVYIGGEFTHIDGVACNKIGVWKNGNHAEPLGDGLNGTCSDLYLDDKGLLYAVGDFTEAGGISCPSGIAVWNGSTWAHVDIELPGTPSSNAICRGFNKDAIWVGFETTGQGYRSGDNTIINYGTTDAYPVFTFYRGAGSTEGIVALIHNFTTGQILWLNYALEIGETLTIDLSSKTKRAISSFYGDVWNALLRVSDIVSFRLAPNINEVYVYVIGGSDSNNKAWVTWKITYKSADGGSSI